jgi:hypothetical protein
MDRGCSGAEAGVRASLISIAHPVGRHMQSGRVFSTSTLFEEMA